jgi:hypothetical protein
MIENNVTYDDELKQLTEYFNKAIESRNEINSKKDFYLDSARIKSLTRSHNLFKIAISENNLFAAIALRPEKRSKLIHKNTVLLFLNRDSKWSPIRILYCPSASNENSLFGYSLALNSDGSLLFISNPSHEQNSGAIFVYKNAFCIDGSITPPSYELTKKELFSDKNLEEIKSINSIGKMISIDKNGESIVFSYQIGENIKLAYCEKGKKPETIFIESRWYKDIFCILFDKSGVEITICCKSCINDKPSILIYNYFYDSELESNTWVKSTTVSPFLLKEKPKFNIIPKEFSNYNLEYCVMSFSSEWYNSIIIIAYDYVINEIILEESYSAIIEYRSD